MKSNLTQREQRVLLALAVFIVLALVFWGVDSVYQSYDDLRGKIQRQKEELKKISRLQEQYRQTHGELEKIKSKLDQMKKGFSLLSFIEDLANKENIRENIGSVKPKTIPMGENYEEKQVEIQMDDITLPKLVDFIYKIENSGHLLRVKRLRLKTRYDNRNLLHVTMQVATYGRKT